MIKRLILGGLVLGSHQLAFANTDFDTCALEQLKRGSPTQSAAEIVEYCSTLTSVPDSAITDEIASEDALVESVVAADETPMQAAFRAEADAANFEYAVSLYQPNYIAFSYDANFDPEDSIYVGLDPDYANLKQEEVKYQVSVKFPIAQGIFGDSTDLFVAYTQTSWWQLFSDSGIISAPFRETNYMPEMFLRHHPKNVDIFGGKLLALDLSYAHQSNGRSDPISRSWNRVIGRADLDYGDVAVQLRSWYRIPEDANEDDNPDTDDYYGYGDVRLAWAPDHNTFGVLFRPSRRGNGLELSWSRSITNRLRIYTQWWYGYGESMIDYDREVNRVSVGFALNDWLHGAKTH